MPINLLIAIRNKDWHAANEAFIAAMQSKVNRLLFEERQGLILETSSGGQDQMSPSTLKEIKGGPSTPRERMLHTGAPQKLGEAEHTCHIPGNTQPCPACPKSMGGTLKDVKEAFGTTKVCKNCHHPVSEHDKAGDCEHDYCKCTNLQEADQMTPRNERAKEDKLMEAPSDKKYGDYPASEKFAVACQECGKKFKATGSYPKCPKCGSHDIDLAEQREFTVRLVENRYEVSNEGMMKGMWKVVDTKTGKTVKSGLSSKAGAQSEADASNRHPDAGISGSDIKLAEQREFAVRLVEAEHWSDFQKWKNEKSGEVVSAAELNNRGANLGRVSLIDKPEGTQVNVQGQTWTRVKTKTIHEETFGATRKRMSFARLGKIPWNKGLKQCS